MSLASSWDGAASSAWWLFVDLLRDDARPAFWSPAAGACPSSGRTWTLPPS